MKTYIKYCAFIMAAFCSCTEDKTIVEEIIHKQPVAFSFNQAVEKELQIDFKAGDLIGVNEQTCTMLANGQISLYEIPATADYIVYHPYDAKFSEKNIEFNIPEQQEFEEKGVNPASFPLYAITNNEGFDNLVMNPVCGSLKVTVPAADEGFTSVTSVTIKSKEDVLINDLVVNPSTNEIVQKGEGFHSVTLKGNIDLTEGKDLYFVLPSITFSEDLEIVFHSVKGEGTAIVNVKGKSIEKGKILSISVGAINWLATSNYYGKSNSIIVAPGTRTVTVDCTPYYTTDINYSYENILADNDKLPLSAKLLWNDVSTNFVTKVTLADDRKSFLVDLNGECGNAVVAIYDNINPDAEEANVLWSFHIWVTEINEHNLGTNIKGNNYIVLDRNLGAVCTIPGDTRSIGLLYQWGRKDPFVSTSEFGMNTKSVLYNQDGVVKESSQKSDNSKGTIEYAIKNPMTYIVDGNSKSNTSQLPYQYAYDWMQYADDALWGNPYGYEFPDASLLKKSIYDPCPEGYMVAPRDTWMTADSEKLIFDDNGSWDVANLGYLLIYNGQTMWYPVTGVRSARGGGLTACNEYGCCLFSSPDGNKNAKAPFIKIMKSGVEKSADRRANAYPVRCVRIIK